MAVGHLLDHHRRLADHARDTVQHRRLLFPAVRHPEGRHPRPRGRRWLRTSTPCRCHVHTTALSGTPPPPHSESTDGIPWAMPTGPSPSAVSAAHGQQDLAHRRAAARHGLLRPRGRRRLSPPGTRRAIGLLRLEGGAHGRGGRRHGGRHLLQFPPAAWSMRPWTASGTRPPQVRSWTSPGRPRTPPCDGCSATQSTRTTWPPPPNWHVGRPSWPPRVPRGSAPLRRPCRSGLARRTRSVLWHAQTLLREFRGDGHIAPLVQHGIDPVEALGLHLATGSCPRRSSGPPGAGRTTSGRRQPSVCACAGWLRPGDTADHLVLSRGGHGGARAIEGATDRLSVVAYEALGEDGCDTLRRLVRPFSRTVVAASGMGWLQPRLRVVPVAVTARPGGGRHRRGQLRDLIGLGTSLRRPRHGRGPLWLSDSTGLTYGVRWLHHVRTVRAEARQLGVDGRVDDRGQLEHPVVPGCQVGVGERPYPAAMYRAPSSVTGGQTPGTALDSWQRRRSGRPPTIGRGPGACPWSPRQRAPGAGVPASRLQRAAAADQPPGALPRRPCRCRGPYAPGVSGARRRRRGLELTETPQVQQRRRW